MGIKYSVDETFFNSWNRRMAYVLGYIFADGNIGDYPYMRAKYLKIDSTDLITIQNLASWLGSKHTIFKRKSSWKNGKDIYGFRIGSQQIFEALWKRGVRPKKSLTMVFPKIPKHYLLDFVRGYFDGDGCVHLEKVIRQSGIVRPRKLNIIFTSGSSQFLQQLAVLLTKHIGIRTVKVIRASTAFQLRYGTKDSMILYNELYKDCKKGDYLERKHEIFEEFFRLHKGHVAKIANAAVCKTATRGCKSHHGLKPNARVA